MRERSIIFHHALEVSDVLNKVEEIIREDLGNGDNYADGVKDIGS